MLVEQQWYEDSLEKQQQPGGLYSEHVAFNVNVPPTVACVCAVQST